MRTSYEKTSVVRIQDPTTDDPTKFYETYIYYDIGGPNWDMGTSKRGLYLLVTPVEIKDNWRKTTAYSGFKYCLKELKRKSKKELEYAEDWIQGYGEDILKSWKVDDAHMWKIIDSYGKTKP